MTGNCNSSNEDFDFWPNSTIYSLGNKEMKILIKLFQNTKNVHLYVIFLMRKALINLT